MKNIIWIFPSIFLLVNVYVAFIFLKQEEERLEGCDEIYFFLKNLVVRAEETITYVSIINICLEHPLHEIMDECPGKIKILEPPFSVQIPQAINGNFILIGDLLYVEKDGRAAVIRNPVSYMRKKYVNFLEEIREYKV